LGLRVIPPNIHFPSNPFPSLCKTLKPQANIPVELCLYIEFLRINNKKKKKKEEEEVKKINKNNNKPLPPYNLYGGILSLKWSFHSFSSQLLKLS